MFTLTSPIWFAGHEVERRVQLRVVVDERTRFVGSGVPVPPAKWSPSSTVTTNSVLLLSMPCAARFWKNAANASSYAFSCAW